MADASRHQGRAPDREFELIGAYGTDLASPSRAGPAQNAEIARTPQPPDPDLHPGRVSTVVGRSLEATRAAWDATARARRLCEQSRELIASANATLQASKLARRY